MTWEFDSRFVGKSRAAAIMSGLLGMLKVHMPGNNDGKLVGTHFNGYIMPKGMTLSWRFAPMYTINCVSTRKRQGIKNVLYFIFGAVAFLFSLTTFSFAEEAPPLEITQNASHYFANQYFSILEDPTQKLNLKDVIAPETAARFKANKEGKHNFGFSNSAYWFQLKLINRLEHPETMVLSLPQLSLVNSVEYFRVEDGKTVDSGKSGNRYPFSEWAVNFPNHAYRISLNAGGATDIFIRTQSMEPLELSFSLERNAEFENQRQWYYVIIAALISAWSVLIIYNLFLWISLRDLNYLLYVLYNISTLMLLLAFYGFLFSYAWPNSTYIAEHSLHLFWAFVLLFGTLFLIYFADTKRNARYTHKILVFYCYYELSFSFMIFAYPNFMHICFLSSTVNPFLAAIFINAGAIEASIKRNRQAFLFLISFQATTVGSSITMMAVHGVGHNKLLFQNAAAIGWILEMLLLSLALADRIKILREEKEAAEARTIDILVKSKEELEGQVALKTEEHLTARQEAEKAQKDAENATRLKDKFVSLVTHDLKSPLSSLTLGLETLHNDENLPPGNRQFVGKMATHSRELLNMTERLLDISRLQAGRIIPQKRFLNCRNFIAAQIALYQTTATQKEITVINDIPDTMKVYADPDLFGECVKNVLSNALKFCDKGDTVTFFNPPDMPSTIAVKDNGPGIAPEKMPLLFTAEMKTRSLGTAGEKGTGIGLPHAKELMEAHGGGITVESEPGKGSTFFLTLPPSFNVTVLVVDDQEVVRAAIREHCADVFPGILEAGNGAEALEIIKNVTPHLIITDINMPVINGLEFIQQVRNDGLARRVPIIAMTSDESWPTPNGMDIRSYCLHIGADDFVNKPVAANDLVPRVTRLLQGAR